ncbi:MAG: DUF3306 domain-containing protein [Acetobacteraceae bacterium]|nr:DUF3306 domain-containing protein [Acetobacteraceae bacterium]
MAEEREADAETGRAEGFLARWSRRKRAAREGRPVAAEPEVGPPSPEPEAAPAADAGAAEEEPVDLESLPKIEEITLETDLSVFFRKGVPAALRNAALRRAWSLDPTIRDFIGPADYAWDWNTPGGVPDFVDQVGETPAIRALVERMFSPSPPSAGRAGRRASLPPSPRWRRPPPIPDPVRLPSDPEPPVATLSRPAPESAAEGSAAAPAIAAARACRSCSVPCRDAPPPRRRPACVNEPEPVSSAYCCSAITQPRARPLGKALSLCLQCRSRSAGGSARTSRVTGTNTWELGCQSGVARRMTPISGERVCIGCSPRFWRVRRDRICWPAFLGSPTMGRRSARRSPALPGRPTSATPEAVEREFFDLFIGVGRGELLPYASYYLTGFLHERPLARLRGDLARLGVARAEGVAEPEDHIATLCEVMAGLIDGTFPAPAGEDGRFFERHLRPWAERFFADLEGAKAARFYRAVGTLGGRFVAIETEALALPA